MGVCPCARRWGPLPLDRQPAGCSALAEGRGKSPSGPARTCPIACGAIRELFSHVMAVAIEYPAYAHALEEEDVRRPDPLGFMAGRRYTCYCGRSVVGSALCPECAEEMAGYFRAAARRTVAATSIAWTTAAS